VSEKDQLQKWLELQEEKIATYPKVKQKIFRDLVKLQREHDRLEDQAKYIARQIRNTAVDNGLGETDIIVIRRQAQIEELMKEEREKGKRK